MSSDKNKTPRSGRKSIRNAIESAEVVPFERAANQGRNASKDNGPFYLASSGLYKRSRDENRQDIYLSGPIECLAETRDGDGNCWGLLLTWRDRDGKTHEEAFPRAMFAGDCGEIRSRLANGGLSLAAGATPKNAFAEWLSSVHSSKRARSVERIGWHAFGPSSVYILPSETFGENANERVVLQRESPEPDVFGASGTIEEWRETIGKICCGNSRLVLAVSAAFAGPLLALLGEDGGGMNLMGSSRLGKSTALHVAASVLGGTTSMGAGGYIRSWRSTGNALESVALASCDATLILDELGQLDPKEAGETAYMLANGSGKARANRSGGARAIARWRVLFLSTGEKGLADMNAEAGRATKAGQEVRFIDIPADAGSGYGLFEKLHHADAPGELAEYLREQTSQIYGTPFRCFLNRLVSRLDVEKQRDVKDDLRERMNAIAASYLENWADASGQVRSVARRFAIIALGGELATEFGITGWDDDTSLELIRLCFQDWLQTRGTVGKREDEQAVAQLRDFISRNGEGRFERWVDPHMAELPQSDVPADPPGERFRTQMRAGWKRWVKLDDGRMGWLFLLTSNGMNEALSGLNARDAKRVLVDRGFLTPGPDGKLAKVFSLPGLGSVRLYEVKQSILGSDAGDCV
ncbi:DUF927 domain-containing protein [Kozakia baliensis]|uniref:DUF927 domain-containing protein n=1 Tax=Kozakia baliensis TaxID=153496 RepID=UPI00055AC4D5|nr:DUF927 domain-containing protein [Kozakia baliensis]